VTLPLAFPWLAGGVALTQETVPTKAPENFLNSGRSSPSSHPNKTSKKSFARDKIVKRANATATH
jgi:hypothetical protein